MSKKILAAFDFDQTILHLNSDTVIEKLVPKELFTVELKKLREGPEWIEYMQEVFNILHRNNITQDIILNECSKFESTEGMIDLIKHLKNEKRASVIIISDSNTVFIEQWLKSKGILDYIDKIFTNPGSFNADGLLEVKMYHDQDWCSLSTRNLCKGYILESYLKEEEEKGIHYDLVAYVGDGRNDLCPVLKLKDVDLCFPRKNYTLNKILNNNADVKSQMKASVHPWSKADDILSVLKDKTSAL